MAGSGANSKESQSSGEMVPPANDVSGQEGSDKDSSDKKVATDNTQKEPNKKASSPTEELILNHSQIHVLTSSKDAIMPNKDTKVVICSYGLVPLLIKSQAIVPGQFAACIVDESHMLKVRTCILPAEAPWLFYTSVHTFPFLIMHSKEQKHQANIRLGARSHQDETLCFTFGDSSSSASCRIVAPTRDSGNAAIWLVGR